MLFIAAFFLMIGTALAQTKVNGTVIAQEDNSPVIGASVLVVGTNTGTVTDAEGKFSLTVPAGKNTLRITYVGMEPLEVSARPNMRIILTNDQKALDEVIVVGYGTQHREAKTGSITSVNGSEIADIPALSVDKMLAGKLAGVMITQSSGQPGSGSSIRIRGISSINAGNNPLYVVDGIAIASGNDYELGNESTGNPLAMINPNDIESITVLKDAAAASVYGSRAANGVILITTKSGKEGKSTFTARAKFGISYLANDNNFGVMNSQQLLEYQRDAARNAGQDPDNPQSAYYRPYSMLTTPQTNWMEHLSRTGHNQEYEITMSGGTAKTKYYNSLSYNKTEGIYYGIDYKRLSARVNVDHEINKWLKTGVRLNGGYRKSTDVPMQSLYYSNPAFAGMTMLPWIPAYTEDGMHNTAIPTNSNTNPRATAQYDDQWDKKYNVNASVYLEWKPIKQLTFKTTDGVELIFGEGRRYWSLEASNYESGYPILQQTQSQYRIMTTSNTATYQDTFDDKHNLRVLLGQEAIHEYYHQNYQSIGELNPAIPYLPSGNKSGTNFDADYSRSKETMLSWFGILDYSYDSRYYLQASIRADGSSLFGKNKRWGTFWSLGLSWNIHNEKFMKNINWLNVLKLRASYGINGNKNISLYQAYGTYTTTIYNGVTGMRPSTPANEDLSWEKNKAWNFGLDFRFLKRFSGSIDVYTRKTSDMLLDKAQSSTTGFNTALTNIGSVRNSGIEFQFDANIIDSKDWKWDVGFNIAHNKSKVLELAGDEMISYSGDSRLKHIVGERLFTFYLKDYYGVNPVNGEALWRTESGELTNNYNDAAWVKSGSPEPTYTGGINTTVSWKGLSLSIVGEFKGGNKVMIVENRYLQSDGNQMSMNQAKSAMNYWKKPGDTGCNPKPIAGNATNSYSFSSNRFVEKGDYFRIKDITLSYQFPRELVSKIGLNSARVYGSGLNVYTFHDVNFWDPERGADGMGIGIYPVSKTFMFGLEVSF